MCPTRTNEPSEVTASAGRSEEIGQDAILDRIYQTAIEPSTLDAFIDLWCETDLSDQLAVPARDVGPYNKHIERARVILEQGRAARPDPSDHLRPFGNLAAFVVDRSLRIAAANRGARLAFGARERRTLGEIGFTDELSQALGRLVRQVLRDAGPEERLLKVEVADQCGTMLFRVLRVGEGAGLAALVVSTAFHFRETIAALLGSVFQLTNAEQDVVRLLIGGEDPKGIAVARGTGEGTTRSQIKSITAKMNLRSQTDIVRFVMALGDFPEEPVGEEPTHLRAPDLSQTWLDAEVWKPFELLTMPDGRTLVYHEMGLPTGDPILLSHMGSCMVRWPRSMVSLVFEHNLRVIIPIRAGYGPSDGLPSRADPLHNASDDTVHLLGHLGIERLPFVAQGTDFAFAADLAERHAGTVTSIIGAGGRPCLPGGAQIGGSGRWQRFFVAAARGAPHLAEFASMAVMEMARRIGPEAMLRRLCKDSPADLALLEDHEMRQVLMANIALMAEDAAGAARAFAREYIAFQGDWSASVAATRDLPVHLLIAEEDPTFNVAEIPRLRDAYPWMDIEVVPNAGLALTFQICRRLVPMFVETARAAAKRQN